MLRFINQHYRVLLLISIIGMMMMNVVSLVVYYSDTPIRLENFNFFMMIYGIGLVTVFPFVVTFDATKRLWAFLPYKDERAGWYLGMLINGLICIVSWVFGLVEIFIRLILFQSLQQILVYTFALVIGSLIGIPLGGVVGWIAFRIALARSKSS